MGTTRFAALVARHEQGMAVYGPFISRADARLGADWLGSTDPRVFATRPIALYSPDSDPLSTTEASRIGEVVQLPEDIVSLVATHDAEPIVDNAHPVVVLVVLIAPQHPALLAGPFDSHTAARTWCGRVRGSEIGHMAECHLLPLRRSDLGVDNPPNETTVPQAPGVVLLDTENASVVYGPFSSGMDAALFWHDLTHVLELTNVQQVHVCELAPPTDGATPATDGVPDSTDERVRGWVVRLAARANEEPRLVGPFNDEHSARTWRAEPACAATTGTALPIYAP
jgi:hypothetical protein